jgi:hypothetical protein
MYRFSSYESRATLQKHKPIMRMNIEVPLVNFHVNYHYFCFSKLNMVSANQVLPLKTIIIINHQTARFPYLTKFQV